MGSGNLACELQRLAELLVAGRPDRPADVATPPARAGGVGPRAGLAEHAARDDPRRPAGAGTPAPLGRGLPQPLPRTREPAGPKAVAWVGG